MSDRYAPPPPPGGQYGGGDQYGGGQYGGGQYGGSSSGGQYGGASPGGQYGGQDYGNSSPGGGHYGSPPPPPPGQPYGPGTELGPPEAPKKSGAGKKILGILGVIAIALVIAGLKFGLLTGVRSALGFGGGDSKTAEAKVGDCLGQLPQVAAGEEKEAPKAKIVACDATDANYTVVGRVEGQTEAQARSETVCKAYKEAEVWYSVIPPGGKGYVLCLKENKPAKKK